MLSIVKLCTSSLAQLGKKGPGHILGCTDPAQSFSQEYRNPTSTPKPWCSQHDDVFTFCYFFRISSLFTYKIPKEDVLPLSQAFSKLEAGTRK